MSYKLWTYQTTKRVLSLYVKLVQYPWVRTHSTQIGQLQLLQCKGSQEMARFFYSNLVTFFLKAWLWNVSQTGFFVFQQASWFGNSIIWPWRHSAWCSKCKKNFKCSCSLPMNPNVNCQKPMAFQDQSLCRRQFTHVYTRLHLYLLKVHMCQGRLIWSCTKLKEGKRDHLSCKTVQRVKRRNVFKNLAIQLHENLGELEIWDTMRWEWESCQHSMACLSVPCKSWRLRMSLFCLSGYLLATLPIQSSKADGIPRPAFSLVSYCIQIFFDIPLWSSLRLVPFHSSKMHRKLIAIVFVFVFFGRFMVFPPSPVACRLDRNLGICHVVLELRQFRQQFTVGELL